MALRHVVIAAWGRVTIILLTPCIYQIVLLRANSAIIRVFSSRGADFSVYRRCISIMATIEKWDASL